ncbi:MAG: hypothetical protein FWG68_08380 [Defluviitaleaceae bacterium]|nr:hypothetical protein [Defluviitaleaceae bacterium]
MKKTFLILAFSLLTLGLVAACATDDGPAPGPAPGAGAAAGDAAAPATGGDDAAATVSGRDRLDANRRFIEPVSLNIALWDRSSERIPNFAESYWAEWVQAQVLEDHNIIVNWVPVPRWDEPEFQSTLLAAGEAPDIGYTFNNGMVTTFAGMGGMINLYPLLQEYGDLLPNMYSLLGANVYHNLNPNTLELWSITGRLMQDGRVLNFIREDWLNTLGLAPPSNFTEFENALRAFRDNADVLLGADAANLIPFMVDHDTGWSMQTLVESFIPSNITERDWFVLGFDDRRFHHRDAFFEAARIFNGWFDEGLIWQDFVLHPAGDPMGGDQVRLGRVGAIVANWDLPFRAADAWITEMQINVGPEANFIVVNPFHNDQGNVQMFFPNATDRFLFFPTTNPDPLASLIYLDWISRLDVIEFLAFGVEGVHRYTHPNGAIEVLGETDDHSWPDHQFIPSLRNFDIAITINGVNLGDPYLDAATLSLGYPGIEPAAIMAARAAGLDNARWHRQVQTRVIDSQEGMSTPLNSQRDVILHTVIANTSPADFEATFNAMYQNYLAMGAQAIINEREQAWIEEFGDVSTMP